MNAKYFLKRRIFTAVLLLSMLLSLFAFSIQSKASDAGLYSVIEHNNSAPIPENLPCGTYMGVKITGRLAAVDPDGDELRFLLASLPKKGTVVLEEDGYFQYTPDEGKKGNDSFTYTVKDAWGNQSDPATVQVKIEKQKTNVTYADMEGSKGHYAALRLAEAGIFTGRQLGNTFVFEPTEFVTRGEFLAICLNMCGIETSGSVAHTAFYDDEETAPWIKPYIAAGLTNNIIRGYSLPTGETVFQAEKNITVSEAIVILNNVLNISDVRSTNVSSRIENLGWAYQATVNLSACGILPAGGFTSYNGSLTREDMAIMLTGALNVLENRGR